MNQQVYVAYLPPDYGNRLLSHLQDFILSFFTPSSQTPPDNVSLRNLSIATNWFSKGIQISHPASQDCRHSIPHNLYYGMGKLYGKFRPMLTKYFSQINMRQYFFYFFTYILSVWHILYQPSLIIHLGSIQMLHHLEIFPNHHYSKLFLLLNSYIFFVLLFCFINYIIGTSIISLTR